MLWTKYSSPIVAISLALVNACGSSIPDLKSERAASNITTTEADGVVTATISPTATTNQLVVASASSTVADSSVTFQPGTLAVATTISLGEAADNSAAIASEAGLTAAVLTTTAPLYVGTASDDLPVTAQTLNLRLPLPTSEGNLKLMASGKLVFLYAVYTDEGWKSGVKALTAADLVGTFLKTDVKGFGYFQIAYMSEKVSDVETTSAIRPSLRK